MLKVGLTGGIGSGKSTITKMLIDKNYRVIDADLIAREVLDIYPELKDMIKETFGEEFFDVEEKLLRRKLGEVVFKCEEKRKKLEDIMLPFIIEEIFNRLNILEMAGEKMAFVDAPLLIETGINKKMDYNILVFVDEETQIMRVMKRDKFSLEVTLNRIKAQMNLNEKRQFVDYIIDNSNDINDTKIQLQEILNKLWGDNE